ncbi:hypothetical protein [Glycomyces paridis]|uniref:Uncharacterized protein n=1 Tax=Glycomyces paridis TaxID=2126555 RepID=A0A4S8PTA8_9ACTN|nr:hypothetical protein [Glycomyces paridis]THV31559.1 hypothetical protein E9998_04150 [Glycomyces paridis]
MTARPSTRPAALVAVLTAAALAGCGLFAAEEEGSSDEGVDRLVAMLNESARIEGELTAAETRLVRACLEERGFTVHDEWTLQPFVPAELVSVVTYYPHESFLVDAETAERFGLGAWAWTSEGEADPDYLDYWDERDAEQASESGEWHYPDNAAFDALSRAEQYDWYAAYQGEEYTEATMGGEDDWLAGADAGSIDTGEEDWIEPRPGGCRLDMIEALYGEPEYVEEQVTVGGSGPGPGGLTHWAYRPVNPATSSDLLGAGLDAAYAEEMAGLQSQFLDCLAGLGHDGWSFLDNGRMSVWEYLSRIYFEDAPADEQPLWDEHAFDEVPPAPNDAGDTFEEHKAYELRFVGDFVACGEETDYAATSTEVYERLRVEAYTAVETDVYAWQEEMAESLSRAQELLDA